MTAIAFRLFELPWAQVPDDDRRFRKITLTVLLISLLLAVLVPWIPVPQEPRQQIQSLPPRLAQLVLEKQQQPPPEPKVEEKPKEEPKPPEKVEEKAEEKPKEKPEPKPVEKPQEPPKVDKVAEARKKAANSGLLAFADDLADLRDESVVSTLAANTHTLSKGEAQAASAQRSILTSGVASSGGIDTSSLATGITGNTALSARQATQVESRVRVAPKDAEPQQAQAPVTPVRTYEEVIRVIDKSKGAIFSLYNRALRKDPTLQGKVVLEITIAADGSVSNCKIVSSELGDDDLERKLVARIKLLQFGARDVEPLVVTYPIDFLPS